jgi:hypothetical protein
MMEDVLSVIRSMRSNRVPNYIAPGLVSHLIGQVDCKVRLFEQTRDQEFYVSPHNHRFDFACYVLCGRVMNHIYTPGDTGSEYQCSRYVPAPNFGTTGYETVPLDTGLYERSTDRYVEGDWYHMKKHEYHSIEFVRGTHVLFFEGAAQDKTSNFLEPVINGKVIPTFTVTDWMYHD